MRYVKGLGGLTLLELLIALAVIAIVFLALASGQITSLTTTANARDIADAKIFANRTLESVRNDVIYKIRTGAKTWDDFYRNCNVISNPNPNSTTNSDCEGSSTVSSSIYSGRWTLGPESTPHPVDITQPPETAHIPHEGLVQIRMRVDWTKQGASKTLTFLNYISCAEIDLVLCPFPREP